MQVHHLAVLASDLTRAETFWMEVLGLPLLRRWHEPNGEHRSTWVALGDVAFLAIEKAGVDEARRTDAAPGWHCVALSIRKQEREPMRARLLAHGVVIERESAYTMYFRDPDGALVAVSHYPEE